MQRFGRYPHRNAILERKSTPAEEVFLQNPDVSLLFVVHKKKEKPAEKENEKAGGPVPLEPTAPRLRILALHGFRQNGDMFRKGLRRLRHSFESIADFVFVTSPLSAIPPVSIITLQLFGTPFLMVLKGDSTTEGSGSFQRAWWLASADNSVYQGCVASLAFIENIMKEQVPVLHCVDLTFAEDSFRL